MNQYKTCSKCRQEKPIDAFSAHNGSKSAKSKIRSSCKACDAEYNRRYRAANREKVNATKRKWAKENRHLIRPGDVAYRAKNKERLSAYCKQWRADNIDRVKASQAAYLKANRERKKLIDKLWARQNKHKVNEASKRYRNAHPEKVASTKREQAKRHPETIKNNRSRRRARLAENGIYIVTKKDIGRLMQQPCVYCGSKSEHIDHVIPIAKGGAHKVGNLVAACQSCNQRKSDKFVSVWKAGK